ncbi:hypothetical protein MTBSS4_50053 [Magnetospirillum sp. SS-4]|nr:hypothetical protein MTBSS4_50053 [Magnetospirillum sp. SS-4]
MTRPPLPDMDSPLSLRQAQYPTFGAGAKKSVTDYVDHGYF